MTHVHKDYHFYLGFALEAEKAREFIKAAYWLSRALEMKGN